MSSSRSYQLDANYNLNRPRRFNSGDKHTAVFHAKIKILHTFSCTFTMNVSYAKAASKKTKQLD